MNKLLKTIKRERESNFELLRILAMLVIIAGHFFNQAHIVEYIQPFSFNQFVSFILCNFHRIAVNLFLMVGCWFMVDSRFEAKRVLRLYSKLFFYTFTLLIFLLTVHAPIKPLEIIKNIFPFCGCALWFVSCYICLLLIFPFLKLITEQTQKVHLNCIIILTSILSGFSLIYFYWFLKNDTFYANILWFCYIFILISYLKKYIFNKINLNKYFVLFLSLGFFTSFILLKLFSYNLMTLNLIWKILYNFSYAAINDIKMIFNLIPALGIFYFFTKLDIKSNKVINYLASSTLAVYIIHQTPGFYNYLWFQIFKVNAIIANMSNTDVCGGAAFVSGNCNDFNLWRMYID